MVSPLPGKYQDYFEEHKITKPSVQGYFEWFLQVLEAGCSDLLILFCTTNKPISGSWPAKVSHGISSPLIKKY
jgi:hypothetical protein